MAKRITPEEAIEMQRLYRKLGTYAAVAREMKKSATSVAKYVEMRGVPKTMQIAMNILLQQQQNK